MKKNVIRRVPLMLIALSLMLVCSCGQGQGGSKLTSKSWQEFRVVAKSYDSLMAAINQMQKDNPEYKTNPSLLQQKLADKMDFIQDLMKKVPEKAEVAMKELGNVDEYNAADLQLVKLAAMATSNVDVALKAGERLLQFVVSQDSLKTLKKELVQLNVATGNVVRAAELGGDDLMADAEPAEKLQLYMSFATGYADVPDLPKAQTYALKAVAAMGDVQAMYEKTMVDKEGKPDPQQKAQLAQYLNQNLVQLVAPVAFAFKTAGDATGQQNFLAEVKKTVADDARWTEVEKGVQAQFAKLEKDNASLNKPAPEWGQHDWIGSDPLSLASLKGKVVLIDFFATWCKPCIAAFPHIKEWQDKYGSKGLVIVGLTSYQARYDNKEVKPEEELLKMKNDFMPKYKMSWPVAIEKQGRKTAESYGVEGIPHIVLIDKKGTLRYFKTGAGDFQKTDRQIQKLLAEN